MPRLSSGLLLYRLSEGSVLDVWIAHMGGPFWSRRDERAWTIPKGEYESDEDPLAAARREFREEIGVDPPPGPYQHLGDFVQPSGKVVTAYSAESDFTVDVVRSNTFDLEWPKGSGVIRAFPEIDAARWYPLGEAREKVVSGQLAILDALEQKLRREGHPFQRGAVHDTMHD
jgi:predicted NUDIX family NTP pyrophosphohydrolase